MSGQSRHRRKLEPITLEELAGTAGMSGFCSFLTRDPNTPVPALDKYLVEQSAQPALAVEDIPKIDIENRTTPVVMEPAGTSMGATQITTPVVT